MNREFTWHMAAPITWLGLFLLRLVGQKDRGGHDLDGDGSVSISEMVNVAHDSWLWATTSPLLAWSLVEPVETWSRAWSVTLSLLTWSSATAILHGMEVLVRRMKQPPPTPPGEF